MRGEVWTVCATGYASKPRPAVIVQSDELATFESRIICLFTSDDGTVCPTRIRIKASERNGLAKDCFAMAEKPVTVKASSLGKRLGTLEPEALARIDDALKCALGLS